MPVGVYTAQPPPAVARCARRRLESPTLAQPLASERVVAGNHAAGAAFLPVAGV